MAKLPKIEFKDPWWIIVLKVIAYAIGLILGGLGTIDVAKAMGIF